MSDPGAGRGDIGARAAEISSVSASVLMDSVPDAMFVVDERGLVVHTNTQVERLFGFTREELVGGSIERVVPERLRGAHAAMRAQYAAAPRARAMGGERRPLVGCRRDGSEFPAEISLAPIADGARTLTLACVRDVSERRDLAERLRATNEELERRVAERTADLERANAELRSSQEEREDILRAISHDLRSPLSVIHLKAQLLSRRVESVDVRAQLSAILTSVGRMERMISELVEAVRLESRSSEPKSVSLSAFLRELLDRTNGVLPAEVIAVELDGAPNVLADPAALDRIFVNLLTNALTYASGDSLVRVEAEVAGNALVVSVIDRGPGIPAQDLPHLFERFWRARRARQEDGLGLGLFIVSKLVQANGGRIWVESEPGEGSKFRFSLPLAP